MGYRITLSLLLVLFAKSVSADFIFSAPPREDAAAAKKLYAPLVAELSQILGEKVEFKVAESWAAYSKEMRDGTYDLVLDGPHFVAWRMAHKGHVPLVRMEGPLVYTVFAQKNGPANLKDLRAKTVCCMASPNLTAAVLLSQFESYTAPHLYAPRGGVKGSFEAFQKGQCEAVALPSYFSELLPKEKTAGLRTLFTSKPLPNLALTAGPRISTKKHQNIVSTLTNPKTQAKLKTVLDKLAGAGNGVFIAAKKQDYVGYEKLLEGVVWGW